MNYFLFSIILVANSAFATDFSSVKCFLNAKGVESAEFKKGDTATKMWAENGPYHADIDYFEDSMNITVYKNGESINFVEGLSHPSPGITRKTLIFPGQAQWVTVSCRAN